jgi:hypothetical protein
MAERRISEDEVQEALDNSHIETPGRTPDRMNRWGETNRGRRLRITSYRNQPDFIVSVIAPDEEEDEE